MTSFPGRGHRYDLIVVGAGLSGSEAALACAQAGMDVLLLTTSLDTVCNLLGDGVVLQPQADTLMAALHRQLADASGYVSNWDFHCQAKYKLEHQAGIHLLQSSVASLLVADDAVQGVSTWEGVDRLAPRVALCVGSFLQARLQVGSLEEIAGRLSEMAYDDLYLDLAARGFSFESMTLQARDTDPSYEVRCQRFQPAELQGYRLPRLSGLYAAGLCAAGALSYEAAAAQGRALAQHILQDYQAAEASSQLPS